MATGKTKALTMGTFVGKVMSLLFNMLSRFVICISYDCMPVSLMRDCMLMTRHKNSLTKHYHINSSNKSKGLYIIIKWDLIASAIWEKETAFSSSSVFPLYADTSHKKYISIRWSEAIDN